MDAPSGAGAPLQGARPSTDLQLVVSNALEKVHAEFGQLLQAAAPQSDEQR